MLVELTFEALEQREGVGGAACESGENAVLVEAPDLPRSRLDDDRTQRHLSVTAERDLAIAAHRENRGSMKLFHRSECTESDWIAGSGVGSNPSGSNPSGSKPSGASAVVEQVGIEPDQKQQRLDDR